MIHLSPRHLAPATLAIAAALILPIASAPRVEAQTHQPPGAGAQAAEVPFGFKAYGVFGNMIQQRNYLATVALKDAADARATDAVGAVSGLRGEISMIEGKLIVSYGADCGTACPSAATETATLLATATARTWRPSGASMRLRGLRCFTGTT